VAAGEVPEGGRRVVRPHRAGSHAREPGGERVLEPAEQEMVDRSEEEQWLGLAASRA